MTGPHAAGGGRRSRVAAIDCGTNSIRLLVADVAADGRLTDVTRQMRIVRLGQDVDRTRRLAPEALERTAVALREYADVARAAGAGEVRMVATSAVRDATNRDAFDAMVTAILGRPADVISGAEEAALSYAGATVASAGASLSSAGASLSSAGATSGRLQAAVVVDIGGGSTELVLGREGRVRASVSLDVGSVRLTERHLIDDPPGEAQIADVEHDVTTALARAQVVTADAAGATVIGVAGTITTLAGMTLGLDHYDSDRIDGAVLPVSAVEATIARLVRMPRAERVAIGVLHPGRIDVIAAGAIILRTVLRRLDAAELTVSEHDILDGIAATLARP